MVLKGLIVPNLKQAGKTSGYRFILAYSGNPAVM